MPICKMCLKDKKLIKAHIYPEWVYRAIYPNGKVEGLSLVVVSSNSSKTKRARIGIYDDQILCAECDSYLGKLDSIGKNALNDNHLRLFKDIDEMGKVYTINDINPTKLKNFFLSMLLRAAFSAREEYEHVVIPEKFIQRMKEIIMNSLETNLEEFSVLITKFRASELLYASKKYTQTPYRNRIDGVNFYTLNLCDGYKVIIKIDQRRVVPELIPFIIRPNYPIYVVEHEYFEQSKELDWLRTYINKSDLNSL